MKKAATIKDIAKALGVSVSTVSRALQDKPEISEETKYLVRETAKKMKYRPNSMAVALKTQKSYSIGVVVPQIVSAFYASVVKGIEQVAQGLGYQVFVSSSNEDMSKEQKNVYGFIDHRVDGMIVSLSKATDKFDHIHYIKENNVPLVLFDRTSKEINVPKVVANDADAAYLAVSHLIDKGCKRIALLTGPEHMLTGRNRYRGYKAALANHDLADDPKLLVRCNLTVEDAREATRRLLDMDNPPDAIFGINDEVAIGALFAIKELGLKIPQEIAVVGFSNSNRSRYMEPSLSTMDQNPEKIGVLAAKLLFEQIEGKPGYGETKEIIVPATLIVRSSSNK
ncbi:MAG TPA: LacI family transcriptional regulator [Marinilabiliales bacterium]|jgi:LacI family transcriptional regulator|nr:LacI family transcriptional regulator [Salinivirgaceae bacterium]OFX41763.1 MAG: LacI family transcriptional regulator [Bacteroidetes bacterium GWA2_40_14]OFX76100.1 MAG: LacI family transcriptional regulator [Bacteroidetes bacterium GWD2_40_43]OFX94286.1 MAG: LacI family transcriptional regulator [Bacteroidetes bacterium GWE2_40_63]OFY18765.1 MAG: LacI family transcriptional regulator [Bacteroidetes bacterium GWF2_40_13]OFZ23530.1 MAG: LacI family transcriptional regulator [Bacteroidetes b